MRLYIAGPMRGLPNWNFDAFDEAETRWRSAGHHPFSPAAIVRGMGYDWSESAPAEPDTSEGNAHLRHVLLSDVACILAADAIALLPGWASSRGATFEVALGQFLGLPFFDAVTMTRVYPTMRPWAVAETVTARFNAIVKNQVDQAIRTAPPSNSMICLQCQDGRHDRCSNGCGGLICLCLRCKAERSQTDAPGVGPSY